MGRKRIPRQSTCRCVRVPTVHNLSYTSARVYRTLVVVVSPGPHLLERVGPCQRATAAWPAQRPPTCALTLPMVSTFRVAHLLEHVGPCERELLVGDGLERKVAVVGVVEQVVAQRRLVACGRLATVGMQTVKRLENVGWLVGA